MPRPQRAADLVSDAMDAIARKRPIFHSEADFQHALAWEVQLAHPTASIRLEKRVATAPNVELDVLIRLGRRRLGVELKYPRRGLTAEVDGELFTLATGADDHGRYFAVEDCARLERLVAERIIDSGARPMPSHPSRSVRTQPQTLTSRVRIPVESIQTRESLLTIFARTLSQCGQRRTMPAPR
jgi:hypothetical protein